jgi:hypothetical protein
MPADRREVLAANKWHERRDDLAVDRFDDDPQPAGNLYEPVVPKLHAYYRRAMDLHVHYVLGEVKDFCVVLEDVIRVGVQGSRTWSSICVDELDSHARHACNDHRQLFVSVAVRETVDQGQGGGLRVLNAQVRRLQPLEDCDRIVRQGLDVAVASPAKKTRWRT